MLARVLGVALEKDRIEQAVEHDHQVLLGPLSIAPAPQHPTAVVGQYRLSFALVIREDQQRRPALLPQVRYPHSDRAGATLDMHPGLHLLDPAMRLLRP